MDSNEWSRTTEKSARWIPGAAHRLTFITLVRIRQRSPALADSHANAPPISGGHDSPIPDFNDRPNGGNP